MAVEINGTRIKFNASNDSIVLNCPIKRIQHVSGQPAEVKIDGLAFYFSSSNSPYYFHSLNGYPGSILSVGTISGAIAVNISEIGDILNPNYFKEDIRNWNGQGAAAVSTVAETDTAPRRSHSKKEEVKE